MPPLPDALSSILRSDSTAALAALMVIANAHREIFAWTARMISAEPPAPSKPNGDDAPRRETLPPKAKLPRPARTPKGNAAYHARRREARGRDDQALLETMRSNPEGSIGDWASTVGKGRSSIVSALKRLRAADLVESVEGKWKRTEEPASREPPPKWTAPLSGTHRAHAHA
jgi:hypothetical protein